MVKSLFVFCDGTGNDLLNSNPTNVRLMYEMLKMDPVEDRIALYYEGIGVDEYKNQNNKMFDGTGAKSLDYKIKLAYTGIVANYAPGDKIYLFGFSRGSLIARSLSCFIRKFGILRKECGLSSLERIFIKYKVECELAMGRVPSGCFAGLKALKIADWTQYQEFDEEFIDFCHPRNLTSEQLEKLAKIDASLPSFWPHIPNLPNDGILQIEFMGLFDTVHGLKPRALSHHDLVYYPDFHHRFCHIMASDLTKVFRNLSFAIRDESCQNGTCADLDSGDDNMHCEVRFPGDHGCVGGGWFDRPEYNKGVLANDALRFMMIKCGAHLFYFFDADFTIQFVETKKELIAEFILSAIDVKRGLNKQQCKEAAQARHDKLTQERLAIPPYSFPTSPEERKKFSKSILNYQDMVIRRGPAGRAMWVLKYCAYQLISQKRTLRTLTDDERKVHFPEHFDEKNTKFHLVAEHGPISSLKLRPLSDPNGNLAGPQHAPIKTKNA